MFEVSLADLQGDEDHAFRKIRLRAEDVQGRNVLTNFWVWCVHYFFCYLYFPYNFYFCVWLVIPLQQWQGMDFTTDKLRSLVKKWQSLIEAHVDVKTTDSYTLRMFCIGFTKKRVNQQKRTCYAQSSQIRQVCCIVQMAFWVYIMLLVSLLCFNFWKYSCVQILFIVTPF